MGSIGTISWEMVEGREKGDALDCGGRVDERVCAGRVSRDLPGMRRI